MPPKVSAPPPVVEEKNISLSIKLFKVSAGVPESPSGGIEGVRVRVISQWALCSTTTPIFGQPDLLPWTLDDNQNQNASVQYKFDVDIGDKEKLIKFQADSGMYFIFNHTNDTALKPFHFLYLDCSRLLIQKESLVLKQKLTDEYTVEISLSNLRTFATWEKLLPLQPVVIQVKSLNSFPSYDNEESESALQNVYIYGSLPLHSHQSKPMICYPTNYQSSFTKSSSSSKVYINQEVVLLPGLIDIKYFQDLMSTVTYGLEVFQDDLMSRIFSTSTTEKYLSMLQEEPGGLGLPGAPAAAAAAGGGKKGAPAAAAGGAAGAAGGANVNVLGASVKSDEYIIQMILSALQEGKKIRNHGLGSFRLESLLSKTNDLMVKFQRKRFGVRPEEDHIVVKDKLANVEVRLEKPSHPEKWDLPSDISLKSALVGAKEKDIKEKELSGMIEEDPTATFSSTFGSSASHKHLATTTKKKVILNNKPPPRHELFLMSGTNLTLAIELHRSIDEEVQNVDSSLPLINSDPFPLSKSLTTSLYPPLPTNPFGKTMKLGSTLGGTMTSSSLPPSPGNNAPATSPGGLTQTDPDTFVDLTDEKLQTILKETPFTRMIVIFKYLDDETLRAINDGITVINKGALPDIQGTIRSYSLSEKEVQAVEKGETDIISGFMILDDDERMLVIEGLARMGGGIERFYTEYLPKLADNTKELTIHCNPTVLYPHRMYATYAPDIKRIRIRGKLTKLVKKPEIYNRNQVEEICFQALDLLMSLKTIQDMKTSKKLSLYPTSEALNKVELLYGEAITRADMDGTLMREFVQTFEDKKSPKKQHVGHPELNIDYVNTNSISSRRHPRSSSTTLDTTNSPKSSHDAALSPATGTSKDAVAAAHAAAERRKEREQNMRCPPTNSRNETFEYYLSTRPQHRVDHIKEQLQRRKDAYQNMLFRRASRDRELQATITKILGPMDATTGKMPKVYLYSSQSKNFKTAAWSTLREKISHDHHATYTMSKEYLSLSICVVDEDKVAQQEKELEKSQRLTQKGFQYPKPKSKEEMTLHPKRPTDARICELEEPFVDHSDVGNIPAISEEQRFYRDREKSFRTQFHLEKYFGALELPEFEKDFELKHIGHGEILPRGEHLNAIEKNPNYFRSVHLGGENQRQIVEEAIEAEKKLWESKLVVDTINFKVGGFKVRDKPIQMDRTQSILKDPPMTKALTTGKVKMEPIPLTILNSEPYAPQAGEKYLLRSSDPQKFVTATLKTGMLNGQITSASQASASTTEKPIDFLRYIHDPKEDTYAKVCKRKHPPLDRSTKDCQGPKWG